MARRVLNMRGKILLVMTFLCLDFLTSNIFLYTSTKLFGLFSRFTKRSIAIGYTIRRRDASQLNTNLIILSHSRSGSSFLGQIFNHHPDVFYLYEPFHMMKVTTLGQSNFYESSALKLLNDILTCNFENQDEFLSFLSNFPHSRYSSRALTVPFCNPNKTNVKTGRVEYICKGLEATYTSRVCSSYKHRVIKLLTHRIPNLTVNFFKPLMKSELNVRMIQLVRDPRAIVASMQRVGWVESYTQTNSQENSRKTPFQIFEQRVKKFCLSMLDTIKFIVEAQRKLKGRYILVRYEDLVIHISSTIYDVMTFAQLRSSDDVTGYLQRSTHARLMDSYQQNYDYSTERANISNLTDSWRRSLKRDQIILVEKYCKPAMTVLQYPAVFIDHVQKEYNN